MQQEIACESLGVAKADVFGYSGLVIRFFRFPHSNSSDPETGKLAWLVRLRWAAIVMFLLAVIPGLAFHILDRNSVPIYFGAIVVLFLLNMITQANDVGTKKKVDPLQVCFQMAMDLLVLAGLLSVTGGFMNPFVVLFLVNAALGGVLIRGRYSWPFLLLCHTLLLGLQLQYAQAHPFEMNVLITSLFTLAHVFVFATWLVMRSLGGYLERQSEAEAKIQIQFEKQNRLRAVGALAAGFSHEFASPLNAAKLRLDRIKRIAKEPATETEIHENLDEAIQAIVACEAVIHQMNSSQMDVREYTLKKVPIKDLIHDIVDSWKEENPAAQLVVQIECEDLIRIPPINFAQVVLNLLDNGWEAAPDKNLHLRFHQKYGRYVLTIEDEGSGFAAAVLQRRGEPFVTTKTHGTGLGLYVSEIFAQSLGGELLFENKEDSSGALVSLSWPRLADEVLA